MVGAGSSRREPLLQYASGGVDAAEVERGVAPAWAEILGDPAARTQAAEILGVPARVLDAAGPDACPVAAEVGASGTGAVDTAVLVFATTVGYDLLKDFAKDAAEAALRDLWRKLVKPRIERHLPLDAIGEERSKPEAGTVSGGETVPDLRKPKG